MECIGLFPVPVFRYRYENWQEIQDILLPKFLEAEKNNTKKTFYPNGYTSYNNDNDNILFWDEAKELLNFVGSAVYTSHVETSLSGNVFLQYSWFTIGRKYSYHEQHNHLPSTWSGVYYIKSNEEQSPITFMNRNTEYVWPYPANPIEYNPLNSSETRFSTNSGDCIIFPSYLNHKVEQSMTDDPRVTIAFNFGVTDQDPSEEL